MPRHELEAQSIAESYLKAREIGVYSVREKQELGWIEVEKVRTRIIGRRTKENWERRNREPRGTIEQRVCAHRGHNSEVLECDAQGEIVQKRGAVETRQ